MLDCDDTRIVHALESLPPANAPLVILNVSLPHLQRVSWLRRRIPGVESHARVLDIPMLFFISTLISKHLENLLTVQIIQRILAVIGECPFAIAMMTPYGRPYPKSGTDLIGVFSVPPLRAFPCATA